MKKEAKNFYSCRLRRGWCLVLPIRVVAERALWMVQAGEQKFFGLFFKKGLIASSAGQHVITLSRHTQKDMAKRAILLRYNEAVLARPEWTEADPQPGLTRSFGRIAEFGGRFLRVMHRPDGADTFIVTAHWHRGAKKP